MGFIEWLTGRNGIYEDEEAVAAAKAEIESISTSDIEIVKTEVAAAITALNNVTGFAQYVGQLSTTAFDPVIDHGKNYLTAIIEQIDAKVQEIEDYNNSDLIDKATATGAMIFGKIGEGFVGAFEDVGDAVVVAGAWGSKVLGFDEASENLSNFAEKDLSGEMFDKLIYSKEWVQKATAITEDSGAASITRGIGQGMGYMTMGGYLSGASKATKSKGVFSALSSTTNSNTLVAAAGGFGSGTEAGLQQGKTLLEATGQGVKEGLIQGGMAYGAGKIGEAQQTRAVNQRADDMVAAGKSREFADSWAKSEINAIKRRGGYTDKLTNSARNHGEKSMKTVINEVSKATTIPGKAGAVLKGTGKVVVGDIKSLGGNVTSLGGKVLSSPKTLVNSIKNNGVKDTIKNGFTNIKSTVTAPITATDDLLTASARKAGLGGKTALGSATYIGANAIKDPIGDILPESVGLSENRAASQFRRNGNIKEKLQDDPNLTIEDSFNKVILDDGTSSGDKDSGNYIPENQNPSPTYPDNSSGGGFSQTSPTNTSTDTPEPSTPENNNPGTGDTGNNPTPDPGNNDPTPNPGNNDNNNGNDSSTGDSNNGGGSTIVTPPSDNGGGGSTIIGGGGNSQHSGGGFTGSGGFTPGTGANTDTPVLEETSPIKDATTSIDDVIKGNKYTKIPTSTKPITTTSTSGGGSAVIPVVAGLSAAAAAGIGAKVYMDRKKNNDTGEEEEIDTEEWSGEDQIELDYADDIQETENYLDDDDDYGYQAEETERYDARSSEELADLQ